jgi:hypothetical protein
MEKIDFESLKIQPDVEPNDLRVDVIRNYTYTYVNEYTSTMEAVPYHPLGFDLGNGLFYDLNGNLCLRIDFLLGLSPDLPFKIEENINPSTDRKKKLFSFENDSLTVTNLYTQAHRFVYHVSFREDSIVFETRNKSRYSYVKNDTIASYAKNNRRPDFIYTSNDSTFSLRARNTRKLYQMTNGKINLGNDYWIEIAGEGKRITVNRYRHNKKPRLLLTVERDNRNLFFYDKRANGTKIEFNEQGILVIQPGKQIVSYNKL